nr:hypothetical protein [Tanacetum cinerariifolium]
MMVQAQKDIDEAVNEEMNGSLVRATPIATSLDIEQDRDGDEVIVEDIEMLFDVADDLRGEEVFVAQQDDNIIKKEVDAAQIQVTIATTTPTISIYEATLAQALAELKHAKLKAKVKAIVFHETKDSKITTTSTIPKSKSQDKGKAKMIEELVKKFSKKYQLKLDEELAIKLQAEEEEEERIKCLEIIPDDEDDVTIDVTPLSSKSPTIVDYKIYKEGKKNYFQIFKADDIFEKVNLMDNMDSFLLHNLKTMFENHEEDNNILYYLLVEKMYPFTNHTLHQMFNNVKLQVDYECEMAFELLRLVKK